MSYHVHVVYFYSPGWLVPWDAERLRAHIVGNKTQVVSATVNALAVSASFHNFM